MVKGDGAGVEAEAAHGLACSPRGGLGGGEGEGGAVGAAEAKGGEPAAGGVRCGYRGAVAVVVGGFVSGGGGHGRHGGSNM